MNSTNIKIQLVLCVLISSFGCSNSNQKKEMISSQDDSSAISKNEENNQESATILKTWVDNDPIMPNLVHLIDEEGKLKIKLIYAKTEYANASEINIELKKSSFNGLTRYDYNNNHGEYYLVEKNGNLSSYDKDGKFKELPLKN